MAKINVLKTLIEWKLHEKINKPIGQPSGMGFQRLNEMYSECARYATVCKGMNSSYNEIGPLETFPERLTAVVAAKGVSDVYWLRGSE